MPKPHSQPTPNLFTSTVGLGLKVLSTLVFATLISIVVEFVGMDHLWSQHEGSRLRDRTEVERRLLEAQAGSSHLVSYVDGLSQQYREWLATAVGPFEVWLTRVRQSEKQHSESVSPLNHSVRTVGRALADRTLVALEFLNELTYRIAAMTVGSIPLLILSAVGLVDGLVKREVRRWSGGRESSWFYNAARRLVGPCTIGFVATLIVWPWTLSIAWVVAVFSGCIGVLVSIAAYRFKKYL